MRKKIVCLLLVTLAAYVAYKVWGYYAPPSIQQPYTIQKQDDDTLRIAYIGDSWAFMEHPDFSVASPQRPATEKSGCAQTGNQ